MVRNTENYEK